MADIRLITILPPASIPGVQQAATPQNTGGGNQTIANIAPGTLLSGFILSRDTNGNPILRSEQGDITFASEFFLKIGSEVVIRIQQQAGQTLAKLLTVNGQSPEAAQKQSSYADVPEVIVGGKLADIAAAAQGNAAARNIPPESVFILSGKIVPPPNSANYPPPAALPAGTEIGFKLLTVSAPKDAAAIISTTIYASQPAINASYAAYTKVPDSPSPAAVIQAQTANTKTPNVTFPQTSQTTSSPQIGQQINAQVLISPGSDRPLLQTAFGAVRLDAPSQLPHGSYVTLEIEKLLTPQALQAAILPQSPATITELASQWKTAQDIFSLLFAKPFFAAAATPPEGILSLPTLIAAALQNQSVAETTAKPPSFIANLNIFVSALKSGDVRSWLGRAATRWLEENGHEGLLKKLEGEFTQLARQYNGAQPGQWQPFFYPLAAYGEMQMLRFFVKREKPQKENEHRAKKTDDTRFVVEMELSQMGEMQIDGFVQRSKGNIQFDMVIRSHEPLTDEARRDLLAVYMRMAEATGYVGQLSFQAMQHFPVHPMEELANQPINNLIA